MHEQNVTRFLDEIARLADMKAKQRKARKLCGIGRESVDGGSPEQRTKR